MKWTFCRVQPTQKRHTPGCTITPPVAFSSHMRFNPQSQPKRGPNPAEAVAAVRAKGKLMVEKKAIGPKPKHAA